MLVLFSLFLIFVLLGDAARLPKSPRSSGGCETFHSTFSASDISRSPQSGTPFIGVSPEGSYNVNDKGLQLFLRRPDGTVSTKDGVNDVVAEGATVNSTFTMLYGTVTFEVMGPAVPGVVTAAILIADELDEIDVELLGGDTSHWQTNVFAPSPTDTAPLWGVFGMIEDYSKKTTVDEMHKYAIDWNKDRIIWSVDGVKVRTLHKEDTRKNGGLHYPSHAARLQLGIWDASNPAGTAEWAKGPINWKKAPNQMTAVFKSVTVQCP